MRYITLNNLVNDIRENIWKIPHDIDFIIGIPRSGMIPASIIASYLNVPLIDINSYTQGIEPYGGSRLQYFINNHIKTNKVLVIDDTVYNGNAICKAKEQLRNINIKFIYTCVYLEGVGENYVDIYLKDVRDKKSYEMIFYEWNIFQHHERYSERMLWDFDGVFCLDPPDELNTNQYEEYIKHAIPLFIPKSRIGGIITYRLNKYRDITENWLKEHNIEYNELILFNSYSYKERAIKNTPENYKGLYYKINNKYNLFIESNDYQAQMIAKISNKPVYCVETNKIYQ